MKRILTIEELEAAMHDRRAVIIPGTVWEKPKPAAVIIHLPGAVLLRLFKQGMFLYERKEKS